MRPVTTLLVFALAAFCAISFAPSLVHAAKPQAAKPQSPEVRATELHTAEVQAGDTNESCLSCHGEETDDFPHVDAKEFGASIHGKNLCISCHTDAKEVPHKDKLAPVYCATCHRIESGIYMDSDHGRALSKGISEAATCTSCHGKTHSLLSSRNPASPVNHQNIPKTCGNCHADTEKMSKFRLTEKEPLDSYLHSVHGRAQQNGATGAAVCSDCHGTHDLHSAANPLSKVYRANVPKTCGRCHENVREVFERSIHGKAMQAGIKESPVCTDCHGEHTILSSKDPESTVSIGGIAKTCSACHESEKITKKFALPLDRLKTYEESFHGLAAKGGDLRVANCSSCHGWHDILPSYDTHSSINPKNMRYTCGKCHPGAETQPISGAVHGTTGMSVSRSHYVTEWVKIIYYILIPLVIGSMFLYTLFDYIRKALSHRKPWRDDQGHMRTGPAFQYDSNAAFTSLHHEQEEDEEAENILRFTVNERWQHALLILTFVVLAYTGFALVYHGAWWAEPFDFPGGEALRRQIHRWTALVLVLLGFYHLFYMFFTTRGKELIRTRFLPTRRDLTDPINHTLYNLGLTSKKPTHVYPSFIEKIEYVSLIWGSIVMATTGLILFFSDYSLQFFPLWVTDAATLVHFYEAVLACLAVGIWHMYWSIFDPDVYPMNYAWLTGKLRPRNKHEEAAKQQ